jgi:uncharacterized protein with LGFP repeats
MTRKTLSTTLRTLVKSASIAACMSSALVCSSAARADDASGPGVDAVVAKAAEVGGLTPITPNPQWTPNGGVFQFYNGGDAAIYWSAQTGAHLIHGDILEAWREKGFENGLGYPFDDEGPASDNCGGGAQRSQGFVDGCTILCWTPAIYTVDGLLEDAQTWVANCPI